MLSSVYDETYHAFQQQRKERERLMIEERCKLDELGEPPDLDHVFWDYVEQG